MKKKVTKANACESLCAIISQPVAAGGREEKIFYVIMRGGQKAINSMK